LFQTTAADDLEVVMLYAKFRKARHRARSIPGIDGDLSAKPAWNGCGIGDTL